MSSPTLTFRGGGSELRDVTWSDWRTSNSRSRIQIPCLLVECRRMTALLPNLSRSLLSYFSAPISSANQDAASSKDLLPIRCVSVFREDVQVASRRRSCERRSDLSRLRFFSFFLFFFAACARKLRVDPVTVTTRRFPACACLLPALVKDGAGLPFLPP